MRSLIAVAITLFVSGSLLHAQVPTSGNVFFGYSYYHRGTSPGLDSESFNGWEGSLEGKVFPHVGIVADLTGHYGSEFLPIPFATCPINVVCGGGGGNQNTHIYEALFGPRVSASIGRLRPFAELEFGVGHMSIQNAQSSTSYAMAFGGGADYRVIRPIALRLQLDYVSTHFFSTNQNNLRLSTGIVFRF